MTLFVSVGHHSQETIPMSYFIVGNFMECVGVLLKNKLLDASLISQLVTVTDFWEKMKPLIEGIRKEEHSQSYYGWFEYLQRNEEKRKESPAVRNLVCFKRFQKILRSLSW